MQKGDIRRNDVADATAFNCKYYMNVKEISEKETLRKF